AERIAEFESVVNPEEYLRNGAKHYGIDQDEYIKGKKVAQDSIKRGKAELKEAQRLEQVENHTTLARALANGEVTRLDVPRITGMVRDGKVSQQFGEAYIRVLTSPKSIGRSKDMKKSGFIEFSKQLFDSGTEEEKEKALIKIFDATASGEKLKDEEMAVLLRGADKASKEGKGFISGLGDLIRSGWNMQPGVIAYNYLKKISEGQDHEQAKEESMAEEQMRATPERTQYSIGDMVDTPRGPMYVWGYYDDGEIDVRFEKPKK
ncbi:MAG: hypothetical protein U9Q21_04285, partial [Candidatus Auribacterota bacterium]|nr:hypothetical protein [Candidatus Auribacterota bacterium]